MRLYCAQETKSEAGLLIHPTAIIEAGAQLAEGVRVGPYCQVGAQVVLAPKVVLHGHAVLLGHTALGAGCEVHPFAVLGGPPQDRKYAGEASRLEVGEGCVIREYVTMNSGTAKGDGLTLVGRDGLFMAGTHIAHDCRVGAGVVMANYASLGGHVELGDQVFMGAYAGVHQFVHVGRRAAIAAMAPVRRDVLPFSLCAANGLSGLNLVGLRRAGFEHTLIRHLQRALDFVFAEADTLHARLDTLEAELRQVAEVAELIDFVRHRSRRGLCAPSQETPG